MNQIIVKDIRAYAYHGCLPEEGIIGGHFECDVYIQYNFKEAAIQDNLHLTINYAEVYAIAYQEMRNTKALIESVAYAIVHRCKAKWQDIIEIRVELRKINPPLNGDVKYVSVVVQE